MLLSLGEKCPYLEFFWSVFCGIWTECGEIWSISSYLVRMRKNTDTFQAVYNLYFLRETSLFFWIASENRILYIRLNQHKFVSHCYFHCSILSHLSSLRLHFDIFFILFSLLVGAWNYNPSKNNMQENPFIKFYWIRHTFAVERDIL